MNEKELYDIYDMPLNTKMPIPEIIANIVSDSRRT